MVARLRESVEYQHWDKNRKRLKLLHDGLFAVTSIAAVGLIAFLAMGIFNYSEKNPTVQNTVQEGPHESAPMRGCINCCLLEDYSKNPMQSMQIPNVQHIRNASTHILQAERI